MSIRKQIKYIENLKYDAKEMLASHDKPAYHEALSSFSSRMANAMKLMFAEKEIFIFAILQWTSIAIGYLLWVQMLDWIPEPVWRQAAQSDGSSIADLILFAWSIVCVGVAAFPLGIFSACMGAAHFLHRQGQGSTIAACLQLVLPHAWPIWIFTWLDSWITVERILDRLPRKNDHRSAEQILLAETLYYAWKVGTMGILPGLITGRTLVQAGKHSLLFVKTKFKDVAKLRLAYSLINWVVGLATYFGGIFFIIAFHEPITDENVYSHVYNFYLYAAVPILLAVAVIQLFIRPVYILALCDIYADHVTEQDEAVMLPTPPSRGVSASVAWLLVTIVVAVVFWFRYELGVMELLANAKY